MIFLSLCTYGYIHAIVRIHKVKNRFSFNEFHRFIMKNYFVMIYINRFESLDLFNKNACSLAYHDI